MTSRPTLLSKKPDIPVIYACKGLIMAQRRAAGEGTSVALEIREYLKSLGG
jgi:hypothetical protein